MARYIDADALMEEIFDELSDGEVLYSIPPDRIDDAPTIDAVEVVRCADCTHGSVCRFEEDPEIVICTNKNMFPLRVSPGFYCAHGKRKDVKE